MSFWRQEWVGQAGIGTNMQQMPKFTSFDPDISPELSGHTGNELVARRRQNVVKVVSPSSQDLQKVER